MVAFLFPGQGSQRPGMGLPLLEEPWARGLERAAQEVVGPSLRGILESGEGGTDVLQPALLFVEWLGFEALRRRGVEPEVTCGHSLGEFAALAAAGALDWPAALRLVALRGRLMAEAARERPGGMAAILAPEEVAEEIAAVAGCFAVNYNAPDQVVLSGREEAIERAVAIAKGRGYRAVKLRVSGPFHTPYMCRAQEELREAIEGTRWGRPRVPVISSVTGRPSRDPMELRELLSVQMVSPVRWVDVVRSLVEMGVREAVEVGPGDVLTKLGRRTTREVRFETLEGWLGSISRGNWPR